MPDKEKINLDKEANLLARLLSTCSVSPDGSISMRKVYVKTYKGIRITIKTNEEGIPHFHAKYNNKEAKFSLSNCQLVAGSIGKANNKITEWFLEGGKERLIEIWNNTRPSECLVGEYKERN